MYVRAVLRLRKGVVVTLLSFSIVKDFNEITRHSLDVALRFMFRSEGPDVLQLAAPSARSNNPTTAKKVISYPPSLTQFNHISNSLTHIHFYMIYLITRSAFCMSSRIKRLSSAKTLTPRAKYSLISNNSLKCMATIIKSKVQNLFNSSKGD